MLQKSIRAIAVPGYWHSVAPDELGELYVSMLLRGLAMNLIGIFIPVYLYKIGVSLPSIMLFFVGFFACRLVADCASAFFVARYGPKHALALSTIFQIACFMLLISFRELHWPLLLIAGVWASAMSLYYVAYHVDLSKIKHPGHAGKEISSVYGFERVGGVLGPVCGGLLATFFDARYTMAVAIAVLLASLVPIFLTPEPVRTRQRITFNGIPYRQLWRRYLVCGALQLDNNTSLIVWPLFMAVAVFTTATYAALGLLLSLSTLATIALLGIIGSRIDSHHSGRIFRGSIIINALIHAVRPFWVSVFGVSTISVLNDPVTAAYRVQLLGQLYALADELPGRRIAFLASTEMFGSVVKGLFWLAVWLISFRVSAIQDIRYSYLFVAVFSLLMLLGMSRRIMKTEPAR